MKIEDLQSMLQELDQVLAKYDYHLKDNVDYSGLPAIIGFVAVKDVHIIPNGPIKGPLGI